MDIKTSYTNEQNKKNGRKGFCDWKSVKVYDIPIDRYGMYLESHKHKRKK